MSGPETLDRAFIDRTREKIEAALKFLKHIEERTVCESKFES